jgi:hypothetical protein
MSKIKRLRNEIKSKIEVIKKVNDDPKKTTDDLYDIYADGITKTDKLLQTKIDGLKSKLKKKNDNKTDIFGSVIDVASGFLSNKSNNIQVNDKLISGNKLKKYALDSAKITIEDSKNIVMDAVKKVLFVDTETSICGVDTEMPNDTMTISPKEFDFLEVLQNEPSSKIGLIMYENPNSSTGNVKMNREFYSAFDTNYTFSSKSGASLFTLNWNSGNQEYDVTGLRQTGPIPKVGEFINDYYDAVEIPNLEYITKTAMLMTLQGDGDNPQVFDKAVNELNKLCNKLFKICNSPVEESGLIQTTSQQFNENDQDIESYFDFNDVEGIDVDDEDARYRKVLKFVDCGEFEVPSSQSNFEDFVYLSNSTQTNLSQLVDSTLEKTARNAALQSDNYAPFDNINLELINLFVLNVPKAIVSSIVSPKFIFPIIVAWKQIKGFVGTVKDLMKKLYKLFFTIIKDVFWKFIQEFWKFIKRDLLNFLIETAQRIILKRFKRFRNIILALIALIKKILSMGIDSCLELFQTIINAITGALNARGPIVNVPGILLGLSNLLPGYSTDRAYMNAAERMSNLGLNTGPIYGEANEMLSMVKSIIEGQSEEEDSNSFIDVVLQPGVIPGPTGGAVIPPFVLRAVGKKF